MKERVIQVQDIPLEVEFNSTLEITTNNVNYFTHGMFKYPCKFIPQIPRWAILKYTKEKDMILDPFAGSGTTLVEAVIHRRNGYGIDFDKLSQLLCKTKTVRLSSQQILYLNKNKNDIFKGDNAPKQLPDLHNLGHWFPEENVRMLSQIKINIHQIYEKTKDEQIFNFLLVCYASIIKKCSFADGASPKPYVSKRIEKKPLPVKEAFLHVLESFLKRLQPYVNEKHGQAKIISDDARKIKCARLEGKMSLAITSPPYINAFDYVRALRLENAWLGFYGDSNIVSVKKRQIGTENIPSVEYKREIDKTNNKRLNAILRSIIKIDRRRAFVVLRYFRDIERNIIEVNKMLKKEGHYIIVIGDSRIRGIDISTHEIIIDIAKRHGYDLCNMFSYVIRNRYLRIPRSGRGGLIKKDWVVDLVKVNGKTN